VRSQKPVTESLRELLDEKKWSDTRLMYEAEVSPSTVSSYLSGKRGYALDFRSIRTLEKFAKALQVEPEYFREYRQYRAQELLREMIAAGEIDLEDLEEIRERRKAEKKAAPKTGKRTKSE
jgi:transcriptional regulator with XRE-family HTH domain